MPQLPLDEGLALDVSGRPTAALLRLDLDAWHSASEHDVAAAVDTVLGSLTLRIGVATRTPPVTLLPLVEALTVTLAGPGVDLAHSWLVAVADPQAEYAGLEVAVGSTPQAAVALGQLLRQTSVLDTLTGLAAEAAVYSMLLGGPEFASWLRRRGERRAVDHRGPLVRVDRDGNRLRIVLDHPDRRNAFSFAMREELVAALELAEFDSTIEQVDVSGAGPAFCSGGDLAEFGTAHDLAAAYVVRLDRAPWRHVDRLRDRVRVHVQGAAVGAGIELAAFAGHVRCTPDAFFVLPELELGLVPGAGGTVSVVRRIGRWRTAWMVLSGARVDAPTALSWGLVDEIAEDRSRASDGR